jgi:hypothetical protein
MSILALAADVRVADVEVTEDELSVRMMDGRTISVPLVWYPRLLKATQAQRKNWRIAGGGYGIHWEEIDEDLSTEGLLRGAPAPRQSTAKIDLPRGRSENGAISVLSEGDGTTVEAIADRDEKGFLDHLTEVDEATNELEAVLRWINDETVTITEKMNIHSSRINRLKGAGGAARAGDLKKIALMMASDMNTFSKRVEGVLPKFEKSVQTLDESFSAVVKYADPESGDDIANTLKLGQALAELLDVMKPAKEGVTGFRDSALGLSETRINKDLTRAANRQAKTLDGVLHNMGRVELFALNVNFLINEKFGNQQNSTEGAE